LTIAFAAVLFFGILTIWVKELWAWSMFQTCIFLLAGLHLARIKTLRPNAAYVPLCLTVAWPLLQLGVGQTIGRGDTWLALMNWCTFLFVFFLAHQLLIRPVAREQFLQLVTLGGTLVAAGSVAQKYSSHGMIFWAFPSGFTDDVLGPFVNRNQYAAWIELLLPMALYLAMTTRRSRILYAVCAAIMLSSVIASGSRMGAALVVAETVGVMIVFTLRETSSRRKSLIRSLQITGIAAIAIAVVGSQTLQVRLGELGTESLRIDALQASINMVGDRPWMGSGLGTWSTMYPRYATIDTGQFVNEAHNDWAQWAAEGGVPFALLVLAFAGCLLRPAFRSVYGLGIFALLVHALVDYPMQQRPALAAWFFAIAGTTIAAANRPNPPRTGDL
jgi:hypothetical protein